MKTKVVTLMEAAKRMNIKALDANITLENEFIIYTSKQGWKKWEWEDIADAFGARAVEVGKLNFFDRNLMTERKGALVLVMFF